MANPRRSSNPNAETQPSLSLSLSYLVFFLKRPQACPILLSFFLLLTWVSLRFQHSQHFNSQTKSQEDIKQLNKHEDIRANLVRFKSGFPSLITKDKRGWLLNPVNAAVELGISGGAVSCVSVHVGQIRPGGVRGNHRHHTCNETFIFWGAKTKFLLEDNNISDKGYVEVTINEDEVALAASPSGTGHALINIDDSKSTFFLGCQDDILSYNTSVPDTDFNIWKVP